MNFSHKIFLLSLTLTFLALAAAIAAIDLRFWRLNLDAEQKRAETEHYSVVLGLSAARDENELALLFRGFLDAYASTGSQLQLTRSEEKIARALSITESEGEQMLTVVSTLAPPYEQYALTYQRSLSPVRQAQTALLTDLLRIGGAALLLFSVALILALSHLTKPLRRLSGGIRSLIEGKHPARAKVRGHDDIAQMTRQFGTMARLIERRTGELEEESARRQRFIDDLSHELRTPITSIRGYAELLRDGRLDEKSKDEAFTYLISESERVQSLSEKLMLLTGMRAGDLPFETLEAKALIDRVRALAEPLAREANVELRFTVRCKTLTGDETLLLSLILNLIQNALRACTENGRVLVALEETATGPRLTVRDNGRGMTEEQIASACDPFYRADKARSRKQGGAGLGLAICSAIARQHGAELSLHSSSGNGCEVCVQFANQMQLSADLAGEMSVSSSQGEKAPKEEKDMKRRKAFSSIELTALLTAVLLLGGLLSMNQIITSAEKNILPTLSAPVAQAESLIPLPVADERYLNIEISREGTQNENSLWQKQTDLFYESFMAEYGLEEAHYTVDLAAQYMAVYAEENGIPPMAEEKNDSSFYVELREDGIKLFLPEEELTLAQCQTIVRYNIETVMPNEQNASLWYDKKNGNRGYTDSETRRMEILEERYKKEGLRPQAPIPTEPTEDGFYLETISSDQYEIHLTLTYELTDEQLLQIVDHRARHIKKLYDEIVDPVFGQKTDSEWIELARELITSIGFDPTPYEESGLKWTVDSGIPWETGAPVTVDATLDLGNNNKFFIAFEPANNNRIVQAYGPLYPQDGTGIGEYLEDVESAEAQKALADEKWKSTAEAYLKKYIFGEDAQLSFRKKNETASFSWSEPYVVYVQVAAMRKDGHGAILWIHPETLDIVSFEWYEDIKKDIG